MIPVIICFGTDSVYGDSVGPQVGLRLKEAGVRAFVYGDTRSSVNGTNISDYVETIALAHAGAPVICVDACLGAAAKVGKVILQSGGLRPAAAIGASHGRVGDLGILAVVAERKGSALSALMTASDVYVSNLIDKISLLLIAAFSA